MSSDAISNTHPGRQDADERAQPGAPFNSGYQHPSTSATSSRLTCTVNSSPMALWDFIQNYMDTSQPAADDAPLFEEQPRSTIQPRFEHLKKAEGRNPR